MTQHDTDTDAISKTVGKDFENKHEWLAAESDLEYVGVYDDADSEQCRRWNAEEHDRCDGEATHTLVLHHSKQGLIECPVCDECGVPEHAGRSIFKSGGA